MLVYRITGRKFASDISGTGAAIYGGRWNKIGTAVLYTGENIEIALLETIVHTPPMLIPEMDLLVLEIPDNSITTLGIEQLPKNWKNYPAPTILSELSEQWVNEAKTVALKVPSSIVDTACNYILNCRHSDYKVIKIIEHKNFHFDPRLKK